MPNQATEAGGWQTATWTGREKLAETGWVYLGTGLLDALVGRLFFNVLLHFLWASGVL